MIVSLHNMTARRGWHNIILCVKHDRATTCAFCCYLRLTFMFLAFNENISLREGEVWWKDFSNKINFQLVTQDLPFSLLIRHVA